MPTRKKATAPILTRTAFLAAGYRILKHYNYVYGLDDESSVVTVTGKLNFLKALLPATCR